MPLSEIEHLKHPAKPDLKCPVFVCQSKGFCYAFSSKYTINDITVNEMGNL